MISQFALFDIADCISAADNCLGTMAELAKHCLNTSWVPCENGPTGELWAATSVTPIAPFQMTVLASCILPAIKAPEKGPDVEYLLANLRSY